MSKHYFQLFRGKVSFDASGVGAAKPDNIENDDDEFDVYRKRMMLAYKFRPNPMVSILVYCRQYTVRDFHFSSS